MQASVRGRKRAPWLIQFCNDLVPTLLRILAAPVEFTDEIAVLTVTVVAADAGVEHGALGHDFGSFGWLVDRLR